MSFYLKNSGCLMLTITFIDVQTPIVIHAVVEIGGHGMTLRDVRSGSEICGCHGSARDGRRLR